VRYAVFILFAVVANCATTGESAKPIVAEKSTDESVQSCDSSQPERKPGGFVIVHDTTPLKIVCTLLSRKCLLVAPQGISQFPKSQAELMINAYELGRIDDVLAPEWKVKEDG